MTSRLGLSCPIGTGLFPRSFPLSLAPLFVLASLHTSLRTLVLTSSSFSFRVENFFEILFGLFVHYINTHSWTVHFQKVESIALKDTHISTVDSIIPGLYFSLIAMIPSFPSCSTVHLTETLLDYFLEVNERVLWHFLRRNNVILAPELGLNTSGEDCLGHFAVFQP